MGISDKLSGEGGYVFVSHSHLDIKKVRKIRNELEGKGFEPILFYLKSLDDGENDQTEFLRTLIYNEIDAREFFLYLDSENARKSKWVQKELEYVEKNAPHKITTVNLSEAYESITKKLEALASQMRIFISYSQSDKEIAYKIATELKNADFRVYYDFDSLAGANFAQSITNMIDEAAAEGIILFVVSRNALRSSLVKAQINYAMNIKARIMTVVVDDCINDQGDPFLRIISRYQCYILKNKDDREEYKRLVKRLREIPH